MDTREKLETALKDAMRSGDDMRKQNIRMVISAIKFMEVEKGARLDEAGVLTILQKEVKARFEAQEDARKANRPDLIEKSQVEISFLETFLPQQLTEDELTQLVQAAITETGASSPADIGKVMKAVMPKLQGRASGDLVNKTVRKLLQT